jgi:hypothetical protein
MVVSGTGVLKAAFRNGRGLVTARTFESGLGVHGNFYER